MAGSFEASGSEKSMRQNVYLGDGLKACPLRFAVLVTDIKDGYEDFVVASL
jgi:hypothetical protein